MCVYIDIYIHIYYIHMYARSGFCAVRASGGGTEGVGVEPPR